MAVAVPVALAFLVQAAAQAPAAQANAPVQRPSATPDRCAPQSSDSNIIVICSERQEGYRLNPDVMKARKLKGFYLAIAVDKFEYTPDGNLKVKLKIGVFNYPNKALLGNFDKGLTAQGVSNPDKASEDRLLELAAGLVGEQFAQNASAFL